MKIESFKADLRKLIGDHSLEKVFDLFQLHLDQESDYYDQLIHLQGRYSRNKGENLFGTVDASNVEINKITKGLLTLVRVIKEDELMLNLTEDQQREKYQKNIYKLSERVFEYKIIKSKIERTKEICNKLKTLNENNERDFFNNLTIRSSAFLSILAVDANEPFYTEDDETLHTEEEKVEYDLYKKVLIEEKELLIDLLEKGCKLKCIISPANENYVRHTGIKNSIHRTDVLLSILKNREPKYENIEWAISEYGYRNLYILGDSYLFEGHKNAIKVGYGITMFQSDFDLIQANIKMYDGAFEDLSSLTLCKWGDHETNLSHRKELLRESTLIFLEKSKKFLEKWNDQRE